MPLIRTKICQFHRADCLHFLYYSTNSHYLLAESKTKELSFDSNLSSYIPDHQNVHLQQSQRYDTSDLRYDSNLFFQAPTSQEQPRSRHMSTSGNISVQITDNSVSSCSIFPSESTRFVYLQREIFEDRPSFVSDDNIGSLNGTRNQFQNFSICSHGDEDELQNIRREQAHHAQVSAETPLIFQWPAYQTVQTASQTFAPQSFHSHEAPPCSISRPTGLPIESDHENHKRHLLSPSTGSSSMSVRDYYLRRGSCPAAYIADLDGSMILDERKVMDSSKYSTKGESSSSWPGARSRKTEDPLGLKIGGFQRRGRLSVSEPGPCRKQRLINRPKHNHSKIVTDIFKDWFYQVDCLLPPPLPCADGVFSLSGMIRFGG
jgi:hypothetical protein